MAKNTDQHEMPRDDRDWVELLRGREAPGADPRTRAEASRLRSAFQSGEGPKQETQEGLDRLLFRLKREGLLDAGPLRRTKPLYLAAAAALVAALALPIVMQFRHHEEPEVFRTRSLHKTLTLKADDPSRTGQQLAAALREAGASVRTQQSDARFIIDLDVPAERAGAINAVLARFSLPQATAGALRIEVRRPSP